MAVYKQCSAHGCTKLVAEGVKYCSRCAKRYDKEQKERYKEYSNIRRHDKEQKKYQDFYSSKAWLKLSNLVKQHFVGLCVICWLRGLIVNSVYTHHIEETSKREDLMLSENNLIPLCSSCHNKVHKMYCNDKDEKIMKKILVDAIIKFNKEYY